MKPDTLVVLTPGFPENEDDSNCLPAQQQFIIGLNRNFPSLRIIILSFHYPYCTKKYSWRGNTVLSFNGRNRKKAYRLLLWIRVWRTLKTIKKENCLTGILSFWCTECALLGSRFGRHYGIKHFAWILGQDAKKDNKYVKHIRPHANELVALSDFAQNEFSKNHGIKPGHVIPIGINTHLYESKKVKRDIEVLGTGSLIPLKQYNIFIEVIGELTHYIPTIHAMICGKGLEETRLKSMVHKMHLANNVCLPGEKPNNEVLQLMKRTKVFLHTSSYEGFGIVCLEALYAGAHVISFCKPMNNLIKNWYIVNSKEEMTQQVLTLLQDNGLDHEAVLIYEINETAKAIMKLFDYNEAATS